MVFPEFATPADGSEAGRDKTAHGSNGGDGDDL